MSSLKRYRQPTDNSAAPRFRDLPPRFKRQKSLTSPKSLASDTTQNTSVDESSSYFEDNKIEGYSHSSVSASAEPTLFPIGAGEKKMVKKGASRGGKGDHPWRAVRKTPQAAVLSPVDNKIVSYSSNFTMPLSGKNSSNNNYIGEKSRIPDHQPHFPWKTMPEQPDLVPSLEHDDIKVWTDSSNQHNFYNSSPPPRDHDDRIINGKRQSYGVQNFKQLTETHVEKLGMASPQIVPRIATNAAEKPNEHMLKQNYSDPDLRTIEMLRELERVADQTDAEGDDGGVDRKSLVSHHLRMLMCAVDKYTEGVEDESMDGKEDESSLTVDSNLRLSKQSPEQVNELLSCENAQQPWQHFEYQKYSIPSPSCNEQAGNLHGEDYFESFRNFSAHMSGANEPSVHLDVKRNSDATDGLVPCVEQENQSWNIWSSPSFDLFEMSKHLSKCHNPSDAADTAFVYFDHMPLEDDSCFSMHGTKIRKPLYRR